MSEPTRESDANAAVNGPATADELSARLETAERELGEMVALLKRTQADFQNYQARNAREREAERKYAVSALARDLLPALDNLERALAAARQAGGDNPLVQGVVATQAQLLQTFARHGITPIDVSPGQPFDPNRHEAVAQQPSADRPAGSVLQVIQQGFQIHDRILRPASVIVSSGKP